MLFSTRRAPHLWLRPIVRDRGRSLDAIAIHQIEAALVQASACVQIDLSTERCLW